MKIAYLLPGCGVSGGIAVICQHANRLLARGHHVFLINQTQERSIDWFPNQRVPIVGLDETPPDLDILVATAWSTSFRATVLPAKHKFYFVQSDETRFHPHDSAWEHITRLSYTLNFNYLTEARWIQRWLEESFGQRAALIPNGIDPDIFFPSEPLEPKTSRPRVLLEGAIDLPYKGMAEAFEAVRDLDLEVWCVSSLGKPRAGWKCHRFFEQVPMTYMRHIYSSCDILLKLSRVEGFFGPPMEMMACGGNVVVGEVTGFDEYIQDEFNALVVDPLKPSQAAAAIERLINDPVLRERLLTNGRQTARDWQWEPSIDRLEAVFRDVVHGRSGKAPSAEKAKLSRSVVYFYEGLAGTSVVRKSKPTEVSPLRAIEPGSIAENPVPDESQASLPSKPDRAMLEAGATDKLLSWLRRQPWFRAFSLLVYRVYQGYGVLRQRFR